MEKVLTDAFTIYPLEWDTNFFGLHCAKAILHKPLNKQQWAKLKIEMERFEFISIENRNSEPKNMQIIGRETSAFVADTNIQFSKSITYPEWSSTTENITIQNRMKKNNRILEIAEYKYSKFLEDPELAKRGGDQVYEQWLLNSFEKTDKFFAVFKDNKGVVNGFLLYSYSDNACVIELIGVSTNSFNAGIGTKLFKTVETKAYENSIKTIKVGTQIRNTNAINFYHKVGCVQQATNQIYHLWNIDKLKNGEID
ncbi:GNAT family N-acetyltransferase [Halobacillus mangrovi]|uniref:GNAT family N-acetyltransferase n=1 Tax=Halobacillus mangrovi TaxID=402384 RepID=UPI003D98D069